MTQAVESSVEGTALVVDDDPPVRNGLAKMLRTIVSAVETAPDGETALLAMKRHHFDVILTDIGMPGMDGLAFLRAVRERDLDVPVILITGYPVLDYRGQGGRVRRLPVPDQAGGLRDAPVHRAPRAQPAPHRPAQARRA